ncbi:hypothetical protein K488DRAFT_90393 [Vararia minispora EC-137]|uniref:Uncharacterized protein n=1 Tax=Vararia minispora EC-137 TaxID=1314806 RepID=A0ACB8Q7S9_9AGAM|nr:hypothetical protein K488DRAFT_90393 [Vararia minispora EC-137]
MKPVLVFVSLLSAAPVSARPHRRLVQLPTRELAPAEGAYDSSEKSHTDENIGGAVNDLSDISAAVGELSPQGDASNAVQSLAIVEDWKIFGHTLSSGPGWSKPAGDCLWLIVTLILLIGLAAFSTSFYRCLKRAFDRLFRNAEEDKKEV